MPPVGCRAGTLLISAVILVCGCGGDEPQRQSSGENECTFPAAEWKGLRGVGGAEGAEQSERRRELADLIEECKVLDRQPRARVAELLGDPADYEALRWEYVIGPEAYAADYQLLVVEFGPDGRVKAVRRGQS